MRCAVCEYLCCRRMQRIHTHQTTDFSEKLLEKFKTFRDHGTNFCNVETFGRKINASCGLTRGDGETGGGGGGGGGGEYVRMVVRGWVVMRGCVMIIV